MGVLLCLLGTAQTVSGQGTATLSGVVLDETGAVIPDVQVTVASLATGLQREVKTDARGTFVFPLLPPGGYTVTAERDGFAAAQIKELVLNVGSQLSIRLQLQVAGVGESVTVVPAADAMRTDTGLSTVVDASIISSAPLNGRTIHALLALVPGVVPTVAGDRRGLFSVNGQRPSSNYLLIDGVSANVSATRDGTDMRQDGAGSTAGFAATGSSANLVSVDALEEFRVLTSTYSAEYGRVPGGQVSLVTKSGSSELKGTGAVHYRDDALDATDWFVKRSGVAKRPLSLTNVAGTLGGPIVRSPLFFFASYERQRVTLPRSTTSSTPSNTAIAAASGTVQTLLLSFPKADTDATDASGFTRYSASWNDTLSLDAGGLRVDWDSKNGSRVFGRFASSPSSQRVRGSSPSSALNSIEAAEVHTNTFTLSATSVLGGGVLLDVRGNYSRNRSRFRVSVDDFGNAAQFDPAPWLPMGRSLDDSFVSLSLAPGAVGGTLTAGVLGEGLQEQINLVASVATSKGRHKLKTGFDYRRLEPTNQPVGNSIGWNFASVNAAVQNTFLRVRNIERTPSYPLIQNFSAYLQDDISVARRTSVNLGVRVDYNPSPTHRSGIGPVLADLGDGATEPSVLIGSERLWATRMIGFAPRASIAREITIADQRLLMRGGAGIFFDTGQGWITSAFSQFPYSNQRQTLNGRLPVNPDVYNVPALDPSRPGTSPVVAYGQDLRIPRTYQWNMGVEWSPFERHTVEATYLGAAGRNLGRPVNIIRPATSPISQISLLTSDGQSDYQALQVQYRKTLGAGLSALASYTLAEATDTNSDEVIPQIPGDRLDVNVQRGPADFDTRHSVKVAFTLESSVSRANLWGRVFSDWTFSAIGVYRSAPPLTVTVTRDLGFGTYVFRPDLVADVPVRLDDASAPGGWRLNRAAFAIPAQPRQGTLGRNALRAFPIRQVDLSVGRIFPLPRGRKWSIRAEVFNILNTSNFAPPNTSLTSAVFGESTSSYADYLGVGGATSGLSPLFQVGGPRSMQLALRIDY